MAIKFKTGITKALAQDIESDLKKFADIYCEEIAFQATTMISEFAFKQMAEYYGEYDPILYERTGQMIMYSHKIYFKKNGNTWFGGVDINSGNTDHKRGSEKFTEEKLYDMVWVEGYHGYTHLELHTNSFDFDYWRPIKGKPDRLGALEKIAYSNKTIEKLKGMGLKKARRAGVYSVLRF